MDWSALQVSLLLAALTTLVLLPLGLALARWLAVTTWAGRPLVEPAEGSRQPRLPQGSQPHDVVEDGGPSWLDAEQVNNVPVGRIEEPRQRFVGRRYDSDEVRHDRERVPYKVVPSERGDAWVAIDGKQMSPAEISGIKVAVPNMALKVIDRAIQAHGAMGFTEDTFLAHAYVSARYIRVGDGPDQVHMMQLGRDLVRRHATGPA